MSVPVILIAAMARGRVIGASGAMPWRMSSDLKHFKAATLGKPVLIGRLTHEAIGKLLPGRETIIVTRDPDYRVEGALVAPTVEAALALGQERARAMNASAVMVAGGGQIYQQALPHADEMILTLLDLDAAGDTHFPRWDCQNWTEISCFDSPAGKGDDASFSIVHFKRERA